MINYKPPQHDELVFNFTKSGYQAPDFNKVNFFWDPKRKDLKQIIYGQEFQSDYLKSCDTVVVGFSNTEIQIIRTNCIYGGIRDLSSYIACVPYKDLPKYITGVISSSADFSALIKSHHVSTEQNLSMVIKGKSVLNYDNLVIATKSTYVDTLNLFGLIKGRAEENYLNLNNAIKVKTFNSIDLGSLIRTTYSDSLDLMSLLSVIYRGEYGLINYIKGYSRNNVANLNLVIKSIGLDNRDIYAYIKTNSQALFDCSGYIKSTYAAIDEFKMLLHGWQETDLLVYIKSKNYLDLLTIIRATYISNLSINLGIVTPVDLPVVLNSWAFSDLNITYNYYKIDSDLTATISCIESENLPVKFTIRQGVYVPVDLMCSLTNFKVADLPCYNKTIEYQDLNIYVESSIKTADLNAIINPKLIFIRSRLDIALLENQDLGATINFMCKFSEFKDLPIVYKTQFCKDLTIKLYGSDGSNILELPCFINTMDYIAINSVALSYTDDIVSYAQPVRLHYEQASVYYNIDTYSIFSKHDAISHRKSSTDLKCFIGCNPHSADLQCRLDPYLNAHYDTEITNRFFTLKLKNNIEEFRRYVTIVFNNQVNLYYYYSGSEQVFKANRNQNWIVRVEGYEIVPAGQGIEKRKIRKKYIFNLRNYTSMDNAITDMIDRVTALRSADLGIFIASDETYSLDRTKDLKAEIQITNVYKSFRNLRSILRLAYKNSNNLTSSIVAVSKSSYETLPIDIEGVLNTETYSGIVNFNFIGNGDVEPIDSIGNFIF